MFLYNHIKLQTCVIYVLNKWLLYIPAVAGESARDIRGGPPPQTIECTLRRNSMIGHDSMIRRDSMIGRNSMGRDQP